MEYQPKEIFHKAGNPNMQFKLRRDLQFLNHNNISTCIMALRNGQRSLFINILDEEGDLSDICYLRRLCSLILPKISLLVSISGSKDQRLLMVESLKYF